MPDIPNHEFYFSTNRFLWLSLIPESEREELFPGAASQIPQKMVTTYKFCGVFWIDPSANLTSAEKKLTAERAWFGIRTFIKGSRIAETVAKGGISINHFAQLGTNDKLEQVYRSETDGYFQDEELRTLISIYKKYDQWLVGGQKYDEMDIVLRALVHSRSIPETEQEGFEEIQVLSKKLTETVISHLNMSDECAFHKKDAIKHMKSKSFTKEMKKSYVSFMEKWVSNEIRTAPAIGKHNGVTIYKEYLTKKDRLLFSWVKCNDYNNGKPFLLIYALIYKHDDLNLYLAKRMGANPEIFLSPVENANPKAELISVFAGTMGSGPTKPLPGKIGIQSLDDLDLPHNIALDLNQRKAIVESQPLLIDGLAGTGKTAVLSRRAAFRAGYDKKSTKILLLSSNNGVVDRLVQDVYHEMRNDDYWARSGQKFDHDLYTIGFIHEKESQLLTISESTKSHDFCFTEVLLDECQDITPLEFECLTLFAKYNDVKRFSFAGDPLQTLNPTGFDWGRIKNLFVNSIGGDKSESERNQIAKEITISKFHQNYRSQGYVVELANAIQRQRNGAVKNDDLIEMVPYEEGTQKPHLLQIINEEDEEAVMKALNESGLGKVIAICWATDDHQVIELCTNENGDKLLKKVWNNKKQSQQNFADVDFRTALELHSSASIKGGEVDAVLLYKFGSSHEGKLDTLLQTFEDLIPVSQLEKIPVSYAYSRLYVAITRAFRNIYFVENPEGIKFWQGITISDTKGDDLFEEVQNARKIKTIDDFMLKTDLTRKNLEKHLKNWKMNKDRTSLYSAIRILGHLIMEGEASEKDQKTLDELEGDKALYYNDNEELAIKYYKKARMTGKYQPLMVKQRKWSELKSDLGDTRQPFEMALIIYCDLHLINNITEMWDIEDFSGILSKLESRALQSGWVEQLESMESFIYKLKEGYLNKIPVSNQLIVGIENTMSDFFGWKLMLNFMKRIGTNNPDRYIAFIDKNHKINGHNIQTDKKYTSSLEIVRDRKYGLEKVHWIDAHIEYITAEKHKSWYDSQASELHKLILKMPSKGYDKMVDDQKSYLAEGDSIESKLFNYLSRILKHDARINGQKFIDMYSARVKFILSAKNEDEDQLRQFGKLYDALNSDYRENKLSVKQIDWINFDTISTWLNRTRKDVEIKIPDEKDGSEYKAQIFLRNCMDVAEYYHKKKQFRKVPLFQEAMGIINKLPKPDSGAGEISVKKYIFDALSMQIFKAINTKLGGKSNDLLVQFAGEIIIEYGHGRQLDGHVLNRFKKIRNRLNKTAKNRLDLALFEYSDEGKKLISNLKKSEKPLKSPHLKKYIDLLSKGGYDELSERYLARQFTNQTTVFNNLAKAQGIQDWIETLNRGKKGIGNSKFYSIAMFKTLLESVLSREKTLELPPMDDELSVIWDEFISNGTVNELDSTMSLIKDLNQGIHKFAFQFINSDILFIALMRLDLREPSSEMKEKFSNVIKDQRNLVQMATDLSKLTPAKKADFDDFLKLANEYFMAMPYNNKTKLNDEVVAYLICSSLAKKNADVIKGLLKLCGLKTTGNKVNLILSICQAHGYNEVEDYHKLINFMSKTRF